MDSEKKAFQTQSIAAAASQGSKTSLRFTRGKARPGTMRDLTGVTRWVARSGVGLWPPTGCSCGRSRPGAGLPGAAEPRPRALEGAGRRRGPGRGDTGVSHPAGSGSAGLYKRAPGVALFAACCNSSAHVSARPSPRRPAAPPAGPSVPQDRTGPMASPLVRAAAAVRQGGAVVPAVAANGARSLSRSAGPPSPAPCERGPGAVQVTCPRAWGLVEGGGCRGGGAGRLLVTQGLWV